MKKRNIPLSISADAYEYADVHSLFPLCQDPHLNRFFQQCQKREPDISQPPTSNFINCLKVRGKALYPPGTKRCHMSNPWNDAALCVPNIVVFAIFVVCVSYLFPHFFLFFCSAVLQGLLSMERIPVIIRFLPVLFNQLFKVLTQNDNDEVTTATTR